MNFYTHFSEKPCWIEDKTLFTKRSSFFAVLQCDNRATVELSLSNVCGSKRITCKELTTFSVLDLIKIRDFNGSGQNCKNRVNILKGKRNTGPKPNHVWSCLPLQIVPILGPSVNAAKHISKNTGTEISYSGTERDCSRYECTALRAVSFPNFCQSKTFEQLSRDVHNYYLYAPSEDPRKKDRLLAA